MAVPPKKKPQPLRILSPIHKISRQMMIYFEQHSGRLDHDTTAAHVVSYLSVYHRSTVGELLRITGHKRSTMTSVLDRLEKDGLVRRQPNPEDRRSFLVAVTPEGIAAGTRFRQFSLETEERILSQLTEADLEGFYRVMRAVEQAIGAEPLRDAHKKEDQVQPRPKRRPKER